MPGCSGTSVQNAEIKRDLTEDVKLSLKNVTITVYNGLKVGDKVIIGKATGNQKYFILDRVV